MARKHVPLNDLLEEIKLIDPDDFLAEEDCVCILCEAIRYRKLKRKLGALLER